MKKLLISLLLSTILCPFCNAAETEKIILQPNASALLFLDERPLSIQPNDSKIIKAQTISSIFSKNSKVTVKALKLGSSDLTITTKNKTYIYNFVVQKNKPENCSYILDTPD